VPRVFDATRLAYRGDSYRLEWFVGAHATPDENGFGQFRDDDRIVGFYPTFQAGPNGTELEPYFIWKGRRGQASEDGLAGSKNAYTGGMRIADPLPRQFSYSVEAAFQGGDQAGDDLGSRATSLRLGPVLKQGPPGVRVFVEYDYASGDDDPADRKAGTFDQIFPSNHGKYGIADMMGLKNMHGLRVGVPLELSPRLSLNADYHSFWLASLQDALYRASGAAVIRNPDASSKHAFQELDIYGVFKLAQPLDLLAGYAHILPGTFLKESTPGSATTYAYVQLVVTIHP
jgi:hypothetical protein